MGAILRLLLLEAILLVVPILHLHLAGMLHVSRLHVHGLVCAGHHIRHLRHLRWSHAIGSLKGLEHWCAGHALPIRLTHHPHCLHLFHVLLGDNETNLTVSSGVKLGELNDITPVS